MSEEENPGEKIPNFLLLMKGGITDEIFIWNNLVTGPILVGDTIKVEASGNRYRVVERIWPAGRNVEAKLMLVVEKLE